MDHDYGTAYYKAQLAAGNRLPTKGTVFLSIRDADKGRIVDIARKLRSTGLQLIGTGGTVAHLRDHGVAAIPIKKVSEGSPNVVDLIRAGKVDLIVNTPRSKQGRRDGYVHHNDSGCGCGGGCSCCGCREGRGRCWGRGGAGVS